MGNAVPFTPDKPLTRAAFERLWAEAEAKCGCLGRGLPRNAARKLAARIGGKEAKHCFDRAELQQDDHVSAAAFRWVLRYADEVPLSASMQSDTMATPLSSSASRADDGTTERRRAIAPASHATATQCNVPPLWLERETQPAGRWTSLCVEWWALPRDLRTTLLHCVSARTLGRMELTSKRMYNEISHCCAWRRHCANPLVSLDAELWSWKLVAISQGRPRAVSTEELRHRFLPSLVAVCFEHFTVNYAVEGNVFNEGDRMVVQFGAEAPPPLRLRLFHAFVREDVDEAVVDFLVCSLVSPLLEAAPAYSVPVILGGVGYACLREPGDSRLRWVELTSLLEPSPVELDVVSIIIFQLCAW